MQRVTAYVDGFNLYFGLKACGLKRYYWLDVAALVRNLLKPGQQLSDLTTPLRRVRDRFAHKRLIVAFPPCRTSSELRRAAHGYLNIGEDKLRHSQLPPQIAKPDGHLLTRPATWR